MSMPGIADMSWPGAEVVAGAVVRTGMPAAGRLAARVGARGTTVFLATGLAAARRTGAGICIPGMLMPPIA